MISMTLYICLTYHVGHRQCVELEEPLQREEEEHQERQPAHRHQLATAWDDKGDGQRGSDVKVDEGAGTRRMTVMGGEGMGKAWHVGQRNVAGYESVSYPLEPLLR
jgi:hypothetical protein